MVVSVEQSRQATLMKLPDMLITSLVHEFELLRTLARSVVGLARLGAAVEDVDALGRLFATVRLGTRETAVPSGDLTEASLTPAKLRCALLLHALHGVEGVLARRGAVALDLTGHLHHQHHPSVSATGDGYLAMTQGGLAPERRTEGHQLGRFLDLNDRG